MVVIWVKVLVTVAVLYVTFAGSVFALERGDVDWVAFHKAVGCLVIAGSVLFVVACGLCSLWEMP